MGILSLFKRVCGCDPSAIPRVASGGGGLDEAGKDGSHLLLSSVLSTLYCAACL